MPRVSLCHQLMAMMTNPDDGWYRLPDVKTRPGDVFALAPSWRALKPPLRAGGNVQKGKEERELVEILGGQTYPLPAKVAEGRQDGLFLIPGRTAFGILLTRGCEIEHGRMRQLALIRPLSEVQGDSERSREQVHADIIDGKMFAAHYLPSVPRDLAGEVFDDSYVDFRYVCTVTDGFLGGLKRVVSLSRDAVHQLYFGWLRHITGFIPGEEPCPARQARIPLRPH